jgi:hypothetical protein
MNQELQNYINQSRGSGKADAQIRQELAAQGWQQADLDQAFGTTTAVASTGNRGKVIGIVLGVLILILLVLGVVGYGFYNKFKQVAQNTNTPETNNNSSNNGSSATEAGCDKTSKSLPSGYPPDVPVYPDSKLTSSNTFETAGKTVFYIGYCSTDSVSEIENYYLKTSSPWNVRDPYEGTALYNQDPDKKALVGENFGQVLIIAIIKQKNMTEISYQLVPKE